VYQKRLRANILIVSDALTTADAKIRRVFHAKGADVANVRLGPSVRGTLFDTFSKLLYYIMVWQ